ncbi:BcPKS18, polyketide synthase [Delitschia confertaspora ATCC 74209]|uniref:BcPKS18, polyketide synthase n=1 Tax=Delitschia confertaspora ATCC 74209 TaxID=1513339 RepID=A0A9P4JUB4_9PLEO|nr:BcPKS18, polyketide synthase [Delitschia confertaspora ATCC 74209]
MTVMSSPSLFVFGPQTPWPNADYLLQLRALLLLEPRLRGLVSAIKGLPSLFEDLVHHDPRLRSIAGVETLEKLASWIDEGSFELTTSIPPNILSMPFTVIIHLSQWIHYLENNPQGLKHVQLLQNAKLGGAQGFCIGLLSALAIAYSQKEEDLGILGAVALRLATCVGAYIDLDRTECDTTTLAVRCTSAEGQRQVADTVKLFPNAYISVIRDTTDMNITAPKLAIDALSQILTSRGISFKSTGLEGRCHSSHHVEAFEKIMGFCSTRSDLHFAENAKSLAPVRSNADGSVISTGPLNKVALQNILIDSANWHLTMVTAAASLRMSGNPSAVSFGLTDCIPSSVLKESGLKVTRWRSVPLSSAWAGFSGDNALSSDIPVSPQVAEGPYPDTAVAVIGMACKFPGADSIEEFWDLLARGGSMCQEMPQERFSTKGLRRSADGKLKFWGNFIKDADAFDHKFFKKSSREAASMDPQQRILLEVAYSAMESSGYFGDKNAPADIGVYLGACSNDYNDNVASHNPNAFSSLGTLRAFLSGRISHWFDWTGPSITYDTACSSSAVAIDAACKAVQSGECSQAVAGGVSLYTNPNFYQNLAAASFLSPTGPTKPFDAKADGYCRGEGVGLVVLKKLTSAIADGDNIISVISGSAVNQNRNCTYITVPHGGSQQDLYQKVAVQAKISPKDVSYVEAHGTGTPVGDPIEFESIFRVFAEEQRNNSLSIGSVKGNIGHLEGAAGIAALIKVCLMLQKKAIPLQANYSTLNPKIAALGARNVDIPTTLKAWNAALKVACVNNYGAAGSNAAMIVAEPPKSSASKAASLSHYPVYISADSTKSLSTYCSALLSQMRSSHVDSTTTGNIAFNLANKQNPNLHHVLTTVVSGPNQLADVLSTAAAGRNPNIIERDSTKAKPVVLCFGGQVSDFVGLDKEAYDGSTLLRSHLDECDNILQASGLSSLFPGIFQEEPVKDVVHLHSMLFSLQYSCAKSWLDSGLKVDSIIGHSFGQLTALCVSGSLSLQDGLKLVCGRASLMKSHWGPESGSMISVDMNMRDVLNLVSSAKSSGHEVEIACFNGPTSHVLVGGHAAIDAVEQSLSNSPTKYRRLQVTHGFHSRFTERLLPELVKIAESLTFNKPTIPLETCSDGRTWALPSPQLIADHTRTAVYFGQAVQRLSSRLGLCTWVEAGSASSITGMVRRALDSNTAANDTFLPISLRRPNSCKSLADATVSLWKAGYSTQFWAFHRRQRSEYANINLPPYQFEKSRHWLEWKDFAAEGKPLLLESLPVTPKEAVLLAFQKFVDDKQREAEFHVDPRSEEYGHYVKGHAVLAEPLCPAPLYVELVSRAASELAPESSSQRLPMIEDLEIKAPLGLDTDRIVLLTLKKIEGLSWSFEFTSHLRERMAQKQGLLSHATGTVSLTEARKIQSDFSHYERLVSFDRVKELREAEETESMRGSMIYKVFEKVVTYAPYYKGVRAVFSRNQQVAGSVALPKHEIATLNTTITKPLAVDNFFQIAGIHVNTLNDCVDGDVFVCTKMDSIRMSPSFNSADSSSWFVYSTFSSTGNREVVNDIFVFDANTKKLVVMGLGAQFTRVSMASLAKILSRANKEKVSQLKEKVSHLQDQVKIAKTLLPAAVEATEPISIKRKSRRHRPSKKPAAPKANGAAMNVAADVRKVLSKVSDLPESDVKDDSTLDDLGIDSLMIMEVLTEVQTFFKLEIPNDDWQTLATPKLLADYLVSRGCGGSVNDDFSAGSAASTPSTEGSASEYFDSDSGNSTMTSVSSGEESETLSVMKRSPPPSKPKPAFLRASSPAVIEKMPASSQQIATMGDVQQVFESIRYDYDKYCEKTGFSGFWNNVYPMQAKLVLAYTVEAFQKLGSDLSTMSPGQTVPSFNYLPRHDLLVKQLYAILEDAYLVSSNGVDMIRTEEPLDATPSDVIFQQIIQMFPLHADEHKLLHITGSKLAECLIGTDDPLKLLFRDKSNKELLERVYQLGPMYEAITMQLADFLAKSMENPVSEGVFHILELGGGTGGTTKHVVNQLTELGIPFKYTFTDISGALVSAARKKFAGRDNMEFMILDVEKSPPEQHVNKYHVILSTNCIHATRNLTKSTSNMRRMVRPDGFISVVEFTRNMFWFDLVFGLLDGWWLFEDGRKHVLADQWFWDSSMRTAGFRHVSWTDGSSEESRTLRIITAFPAEPQSDALKVRRVSRKRRSEVLMQTVQWKQAGNCKLMADIYFPSSDKVTAARRPVALMIHGGGHVMFTRKEVNPKQVKLLLDHGFLPVSIEYRFCPEVNILEGPMTDACDALFWARHQLPQIKLNCPGLNVDGSRVVVVGWSTGGHLAMTTAFTSRQKGIQPPEAILAFYCPTDYESEWWQRPIYPLPAVQSPDTPYDLLEGVQDEPIASHYPTTNINYPGMRMDLDDPRWRFVLHMNWRAQTLPVLLNGLPSKNRLQQIGQSADAVARLPQPSHDRVISISPFAQIVRGNYWTPTYLIHGTADDLIPWEHSQRVVDGLKARGVESEIELLDGVEHLFDTFSDKGWDEIQKAYRWLAGRV